MTEAIKAVEATAHPVVHAERQESSLGSDHSNDQGSVRVDSLAFPNSRRRSDPDHKAVLVGMLETLMNAQADRHGGPTTIRARSAWGTSNWPRRSAVVFYRRCAESQRLTVTPGSRQGACLATPERHNPTSSRVRSFDQRDESASRPSQLKTVSAIRFPTTRDVTSNPNLLSFGPQVLSGNGFSHRPGAAASFAVEWTLLMAADSLSQGT